MFAQSLQKICYLDLNYNARNGHWIVLPPIDNDIDHNIAGYICNTDGNVVLEVEDNMAVNISKYGLFNTHIELPTMPHARKRKVDAEVMVKRVYGAMDMKVKYVVLMLHNIGHYSKTVMLAQSTFIDNYPATAA
jgi:hypothetical protein